MQLPYQERASLDERLQAELLRGVQTRRSTGLLLWGPRAAGKKRAIAYALRSRFDLRNVIVAGTVMHDGRGAVVGTSDVVDQAGAVCADAEATRWVDVAERTLDVVDAAVVLASPTHLISLLIAALKATMKAMGLSASLEGALQRLRKRLPRQELMLMEVFDEARACGKPVAVVIDQWQRVTDDSMRLQVFEILAHARRTDTATAPLLLCLVVNDAELASREPSFGTTLSREADENHLVQIQVPAPTSDLLLRSVAERHGATSIEPGLGEMLCEYARQRWDLLEAAVDTLERGGALQVSAQGAGVLDLRSQKGVMSADRLISWQLPTTPDANELLRLAAIEGPNFTLEVLATVQGQDVTVVEGQLARVCDEAEQRSTPIPICFQRSVLVETQSGVRTLNRWQFRHPAVWEILWAGVPSEERRRLADSTLKAILALYALSLQFVCDELPRLYKEIGERERARWSRLVYGWRGVLPHANRVLQLFREGRLQPCLRVARALLAEGRSATHRGDLDEAMRLYAEAARMADGLGNAPLYVHAVGLCVEDLCPPLVSTPETFGRWSALDAILRDAEAKVAGHDEAAELQVVRLGLDLSVGKISRSEFATQAEALSAEFARRGNHATSSYLLMRAANAAFSGAGPDQTRRYLELARRGAEEDVYSLVEWLWLDALLANAQGDPDGALRRMREPITLRLMERPVHVFQLVELVRDAAQMACLRPRAQVPAELVDLTEQLLSAYVPQRVGDFGRQIASVLVYIVEGLRRSANADSVIRLLSVPQLSALLSTVHESVRDPLGALLAIAAREVKAIELGDRCVRAVAAGQGQPGVGGELGAGDQALLAALESDHVLTARMEILPRSAGDPLYVVDRGYDLVVECPALGLRRLWEMRSVVSTRVGAP